MFSKVYSATLSGVEAVLVQVEIDIRGGLPGFVMVGSLSSRVQEAKERVRASLHNIGISLPAKKITVNMSPADVHKEGSRFDLPIAVAVMAASELIPVSATENIMICGELSLNGLVRPVNGVLAMVGEAKEKGICKCMVPAENAREAGLVEGMEIIGASDINDAVNYFKDGIIPKISPSDEIYNKDYSIDFSDIRGQENAKRAAVIAAAGFHNMLMSGPPGSGKTMVARRIPTIMPPLTKAESLEVDRIYSIAGVPHVHGQRPFRMTHHTITLHALIGGGRIPTPGELSLAHRGVLFLDELPEYERQTLETLRQPLEDHEIVISRVNGIYRFPANLLLVAAMNPCPCGYYPDMKRCTCTLGEVKRYNEKISGPLLDRMDINIELSRMSYEDVTHEKKGGSDSEKMRDMVSATCERQRKRFGEEEIYSNSGIPVNKIDQYCRMERGARTLIKAAFDKMNLSARGYHRILKVSRTIADIEGSELIKEEHIEEALLLRNMERT